MFAVLGQPHDVIICNAAGTDSWIYFDGVVNPDKLNGVPFAGLIFGGAAAVYDIHELVFDSATSRLNQSFATHVEQHLNNFEIAKAASKKSDVERNVKAEMELLGFEFDRKAAKFFNNFDNYFDYGTKISEPCE